MSEILKVRTGHPRVKVVRAAFALPEVDPGPAGTSRDDLEGVEETGMTLQPQGGSRTAAAYAESAREAEFNRGFLEGQQRSAETLKAEMQSKLAAERKRVDELLGRAGEQFAALYRSSEEAVVRFAFGIAERIIRKEIDKDRGMVLSQIKEGVRRVLGVERLKIRVHPSDLVLVREQKGVIQANGDSIREIVVEPDESLEPGDCVLESDMGNVDARISTQLKQIENMLFESTVVS